MAGQSRKWMILVATIWIQAFTGTNFDFSAYSSNLKAVLGISQVQLNYLAVASDLGKAFGWSSGLASMCLPLWVVMFIAAVMGLFGYGVQWLVILNVVTLPYFVVFLLCLMAGCSICWFNTVCFILCNRNFPANRPLAISLTVSFNGVSAALYALAANAINNSSNALYLLLNAVIPLITSLAALIPIVRQPPLDPLPPDAVRHDSLIFLLLNFLAVVTGLFLLLLSSTNSSSARLLFGGAVFLLILPLGIPGIVYARDWFHRAIHSSFHLEGSGFILVDVDDLELHRELINRETSVLLNGFSHDADGDLGLSSPKIREKEGCCETVIERDRLVMLGKSTRQLCCYGVAWTRFEDLNPHHALFVLLLLWPIAFCFPGLYASEDLFCEDRVAGHSASPNPDRLLLASRLGKRNSSSRWHCADRVELGLHICCCCFSNIRAVRPQQRGGQPQHSHHQHPIGVAVLRGPSLPHLRCQCKFELSSGACNERVVLFLRTRPAYDRFEKDRISSSQVY
ncbi:major facilitator superfamily protein [Actinidia rufa]|uniref:Major facilitator superfamily protein n=1 Tax=Actinidia rufa TaxID=165716 RepID=A0A7J0F949_9ERIC|nr:major facilitator superfamily protein [Actinidia rufa]